MLGTIEAVVNKLILKENYPNISKKDLPIDVEKIAKSQGLTIRFYKPDNVHISGEYDREKKTISISEKESKNRQRFTIAHELGHHLLHRDKSREIFYRRDMLFYDPNPETTEIEKQANFFAASLLMPKDLVIELWQEQKEQQNDLPKRVQNLANKFEVSKQAIAWRLHSLGLEYYDNLIG